ncbi:MAG: hypothetical protein WA655_07825 [Candidatus Korobacteraceae bacterium]
MELRLTDKERELLAALLQEQEKHLLHQIAKADHYQFKAELRDQCNLLEGIMNKLDELVSSAA